jgi:hypothetical protein
MRKLLIGLVLLVSMSSFANTENTQINNETYEYERETFKGKFTKIGKSFVCMPAYR